MTLAREYAATLLRGAPIPSVDALAEALSLEHPSAIRTITKHIRLERKRELVRQNRHVDYEVVNVRTVNGERICTLRCEVCGLRATEKKWQSKPCVRRL